MNSGLRLFALIAMILSLSGAAWADDSIDIHMSSFDSDGVKIAYIEAGKGEPVVLVHGLYSSAGMNWVMPGIFKMFAEHCHIIALDLRGHGLSDKPTDEASYGQPMVEDVVRLLDHLKIQKAHIVGYSLGGIIVMKFLVDHPDRAISGTLGGMGWLREGSIGQKIFEKGGKDAGSTPPACVHAIAKLTVTRDQIKQIKVPVEILVGDKDPCLEMYVKPVEPVRPDWPVVIIKDAGHITCVTKEQFKEELANWIKKNLIS